jgi:hypothetical protein
VNYVDVTYLGCIYFLVDGLMTGTLVTTYYVIDVVFYLWYCCVMFHLLTLKSYSIGKVFHCSFLVTTRKVIPGGRVSEGHGWDGAPWDQLLIN